MSSADKQFVNLKRILEWLWRAFLVFYFFALIVISIYVLAVNWHPTGLLVTGFQIKHTPTMNQTITVTENQTMIIKDNLTSVLQDHKIVNSTSRSVTLRGEWRIMGLPFTFKDPQVQYILLAGLFGIIGSSAHGVASLTVWHGHCKSRWKWGWWYFVRPPIGLALAIIVYVVLRAGLLTGVEMNYYGVAAVSALVGFSTEPTMKKLRDILDKLFGIEKKKGEIGDEPMEETNIKLSATKNEIKKGESLELHARVTKSDGTPANKVQVYFGISNSNVALEAPYEKETDSNGIANIKLTGNSKGETHVTGTTTVDDETIADIIVIKVKEADSSTDKLENEEPDSSNE